MTQLSESFAARGWPWVAHVIIGHVHAMRREGMIGDDVANTIVRAVDRVSEQPVDVDDLVALVREFEGRLEAQLTPDVASAGRVGRSIVDVSATVARLMTISRLIALDVLAGQCESAALRLAETNLSTLMPVTMDGFVSQPTSFAHWIGGLIEQIGRARDDTFTAIDRVDACAMGSSALASSGFAVDRSAIATSLGFNRIIESTFDAVSSLDWIATAATAIDGLLGPLRRFSEEVFTWTRIEPSSFRIGDWLMDTASGIPQWSGAFGLVRLNQDLEHVAFQAHVLAHEASSVSYGPQLASLGRIAYGLDSIAGDAIGLLEQVARFLDEGLIVNAAWFSHRAGKSFSTSSDLADFLMIEEHLSPADAEQIAALTISRARDQGIEAAGITVDLIDGAALMVIGRELKVEFEAISRYLAPRRFIERRTATGAPSPESIRTFVAHRWQDHNERNESVRTRRGHFDAAVTAMRAYEAAEA